MSSLPWDTPPHVDIPSFKRGKEFYITCKSVLEDVFRQVDDLVVECFEEPDGSVVVKLRQVWNDWMEPLETEQIVYCLNRIRYKLNLKGSLYKKVKVQYSSHPSASGRSNFRIIYNPRWRKYENYEIFFRNKTQSAR